MTEWFVTSAILALVSAALLQPSPLRIKILCSPAAWHHIVCYPTRRMFTACLYCSNRCIPHIHTHVTAAVQFRESISRLSLQKLHKKKKLFSILYSSEPALDAANGYNELFKLPYLQRFFFYYYFISLSTWWLCSVRCYGIFRWMKPERTFVQFVINALFEYGKKAHTK